MFFNISDDNVFWPSWLPPCLVLTLEATRRLLRIADPESVEVPQTTADWEPHRGASYRWRRRGVQPLSDGRLSRKRPLGATASHTCRKQKPDRGEGCRVQVGERLFMMICCSVLSTVSATVFHYCRASGLLKCAPSSAASRLNHVWTWKLFPISCLPRSPCHHTTARSNTKVTT